MPIIQKADGWKKKMLAKDWEGSILGARMSSSERGDLFNLGRKIRQDKSIGKTPALILGDMGSHTTANMKCERD